MKRLFASLGWLMLLLPLISVAGARTVYTMNERALDSEDRKVSNFSGISSGGSFEVYVKMGSSESLKLEGEQRDIDEVETVVENGTLRIGYKDSKVSWGNNHKAVKVYITAKALNSLSVGGAGSIKVDGMLKSENLQARVGGSGSIIVNASVTKLTSAIGGSGNITVSGTCKTASVIVSGSGNFHGKELRADVADVKVAGSGGVKIYAEESLSARVSGSGDIRYAGNAKVSQVTSGAGRVAKM